MPTPGHAAEAPKWAGHVEVVAKPSKARSSATVELFLPISQGHDALVFVDARLSASTDSELFGNFGVALRRIIQSDAIIGASVFFDHTRSEHGRAYRGVTFGLEALTETFDARINVHAPLSDREVVDFKAAVEGGALSLQDHRLVEQLSEAGFIRHEIPHYGVEGEVGVKLPVGLPHHSDLTVFAGGYHYWASGTEDITGLSGRIEFQSRDLFGDSLPGARLTVAGLARHDDVRGTDYGGEVRLRVPFGPAAPAGDGGRPYLTPLEERMTDRIVRETDILTRTRTTVLGAGSGGTRLAINPETGEPYGRIVFADGANTPGAGTPGDPTTLDDAVDQAGADGVVVAEGSAGDITTGGVTLSERMALIGGGTTIPVVLAGGSTSQFELGTTAATIQGIGAVNVIRLADGARVENITVTGGQTAIAGHAYGGGVTLRNVTVSGTAGDAISVADATGPLTFQGLSIFDSGGHGLALSGNAGPISIEDLVVSGSAGHGISAANNALLSIEGAAIGGTGGAGVNVVNTAGTSLLSASQVTISSAAGAGISVDGSAGGTTIVTSFADNLVQQAGAGGALFETVTFDADPDAAGSQATPGGDLAIGDPADPGDIGGEGLRLNDVAGAVAFETLDIGNDGGTGLFVRDAGGKGGSFSVSSTGGAIATTGGTAVDLDPVSVDVTLSSLEASGGSFGLILDNVEGSFIVTGPVTIADIAEVGVAIRDSAGTFGFGDTSVSDAGGHGIEADNVAGAVTFGATEVGDVGGTGIALMSSSADFGFGDTSVSGAGGHGIAADNVSGSVSFGTTDVGDVAGTGIALMSSSAAFGFGDTSVSDAGGHGIEADNVAGAVTFGATEVGDVAATAIALTGNPGAVSFGDTAISDPGGTGIDIEGANGPVTFGVTTITGLGAATGVDLTDGADPTEVALTFATLDIAGSGTAGSTGIDYSGSTNPFDVVTLESGTIDGVEVGVDLTDARATGLFQYGDGSNTDADGAASTIDATLPLEIAGLNAANGTYNFLDVGLVGDTSALIAVDVFFVDVDGAGDGSADDPGSLAGAMTSGADVIALVNTQAGAADQIDAAAAAQGAVDTVSLADHQQLVSFAAADTINVGAVGAPANLLLFGITPGEVTNPNPGFGAPVLTTSAAGNDTVTLGDGNILQGVVIDNGAGASAVAGAGISGATLFQSELSAGFTLKDATGDANLNESDLTTLAVTGGSIDVNATGASLTNAAGGPILAISGGHTGDVSFDAASSITATGGTGLQFDNADGTYSFNGTTMLDGGDAGIDIVAGSDGMFAFGAGTSITDPSGAAFTIDSSAPTVTFAGTIDQANAAGSVVINALSGGSTDFSGAIGHTGAATAVSVTNATGGTVTFSGGVTASTTTETAVDLTNNGGATIGFTGGLDIDTTTGTGFNAIGGVTVGVAATAGDESITTTTGQALNLNSVTVGAGGLNFDGISVDGAATGIGLTSVDGGAIALGSVDLQNVTSRGVDVETALAASLSFSDLVIRLNGANAVAFDLNGAALSAPVAAEDFDVSNAGAAATTIGVDLRGATGGQIVRLGDAAPDGNSTSIAGVETGVFLNAATDVLFTFGDGESADDTDSTIDALVGIDASSAPAAGSYDFEDVFFALSPGNGFGIGDIFFVAANATGDGSGRNGDNRATLANAEADSAGGVGDVFVLVDDGDAISAAGSGGDDTLNLANDQQVRGFASGEFEIDLTVPATIQLSSDAIGIGDPTGNGAATLTSDAGADVITLGASGNLIDGFILDGAPLNAARGIHDDGGATGTVISNMTVRNFATGGIEITPSTDTTIDTVTFSGNASDLLLNASGTTLTNVASNNAGGTAIRIVDASGTTTLTDVAVTDAGGIGIAFDNAGGTVTASNVDVTDSGGPAIAVDEGTAGFSFDAASSISQGDNAAALSVSGGHATGTFTFAGAITATDGSGLQFDDADGTYELTGTTTLDGDVGIEIANGSAGSFTFGADTSITDVSGTSFRVDSSNANVTFSGDITHSAAGAAAVSITDHATGTITFDAASSITDSAGTGLQFSNADSITTYNFNGASALSGSTGIAIAGGSAGTFSFGANTSITDTSGTAFNIDSSAPSVTFAGTIDQANAASSVAISALSGGSADFSGAIGHTGAATAVSVADSAGTVTFSGGVAASTTTETAVDLANNGGATVSFTGGLDIDTTTGLGFNATGGGTVNVAATVNAESIVSTAGQALNLNGVTVGATFDSITSTGTGGASTGIALVDLVSTSSFAVTGTTTLNNHGSAGILISDTGSFGDDVTVAFGTTNINRNTPAAGAGILVDSIAGENMDLDFGAVGIGAGGTATTTGLRVQSITGTGFDLDIASLDIDDVGTGVSIDDLDAGSVTVTGTTRIDDATADAIAIANSSSDVTFAGRTTILNDAAGAGDGIELGTDAGGANTGIYSFAGLDVTVNDVGAFGLRARDSGTVTITNPDGNNQITSNNGTAILIDPTAVDIALQTVTAANGANGISLDGVSGTFSVAGATNVSGTTGDGIFLRGNSANVSFDATTVTDPGGNSVTIADNSGTVGFASLDITNPDSADTAAIDIGGTIAGAIDLGDVDIALESDDTTGIDLSGAVVNADITADDFDLTSTTETGTTGIDLAGTTGSATIQIGDTDIAGGEDATIAGAGGNADGPAAGVLFSDATDVDFVFGDGDGGPGNDGPASSITAVTPIDDDGSGLPAAGSYDFDDVQFTGDISNISAVSLFFVDQDGTGVGTLADPGSIAGAEASTANVLVLIDTNDDGSSEAIDMTAAPHDSGNQALDLDDGQVVISFAENDAAIDVADLGIAGAGAPNSFSFTTISNSTIVDAPDGIDSVRPTLTTDNATAAIQLPTANLSGPRITSGAERVRVTNTGTGDGFSVDADADSTFVLNRNTVTAGGRAVALEESDGTPTADTLRVSLTDNSFESTAAGPAVELTGQNITATESSIVVRAFTDNVVVGNGTGGGVLFTNVGFDADGAGAQVAGGTLTIGTTANRVDGNGLEFVNPTGDIAFTTLDIANDGGTGLLVDTKGEGTTFNLDTGGGTIDTENGTAVFLDPLSVGMTLTSVSASGGANGIVLDTVDGTFNVTGAVDISGTSDAGILLADNTGGGALAVDFDGAVAVDNAATAGGGVSMTNSSEATLNFNGGLDIDTAGGAGLTATGGGAVNISGSANSVTTTGGGTGLELGGVDLALTNGLTVDTTAGGGTGVDVSGAGTTDITGSGLAISTSSGTGFNATGGGTLTLQFDTTLTTTTGVAVNLNNIVAGSSGITFQSVDKTQAGGTSGIVLTNVIGGGLVDLGSGSILGGSAAAFQVGTGAANSGGTATITYGGTITSGTGGAVSIQNRATGAGLIMLSNNITHNVGGQTGILVANNAAGTIAFSGASKSITTTTANAVSLTNNSATISFTGGGLDITTTSGIGFNATGGGTVNVSGSGNSVTAGAATQAVNLNGIIIGGAGIGFDSISADGAATGIQLTNVTGGAFSAAGGTIENTTSRGVDIDGGSADFTFGGTVTNNAGRSVAVNNYGGTANFNGAIGDSGQGINLTGNTGTVNFSGGLTLNTGTNTAFNATGGGTVNVTGANNTVTTTTGTGVNISGVTIGTGGVTFQSVSAGTLATGPANGIVVANTGNTGGGFTVNGGTIQNTTGSGILLTNTRNVSLSNLTIANTGLHGIQGANVTNLDLTGVTISSPGNAADEHGVFITGLFGADNVFDGISISGASGSGIVINNSTSTGNPDSLTIQNGSSISGSGASGQPETSAIHLLSSGTANLRLILDGTAVANTLVNNLRGVFGQASGSSRISFDIRGNTITQGGGQGSGIEFVATGSASLVGTVGTISSPNVIDTNQTAVGLLGISIDNQGSGQSTVNVSGNTINIPDAAAGGSKGIHIRSREGGGRVDATVLNNTINSDHTNVNTAFGIHVESGTGGGPGGNTVCLNIANNDVNMAVAVAGISLGLFAPVAGDPANTFELQGFEGDGTQDNEVREFIDDENPLTDTGTELFGITSYTAGVCQQVP